VILLVAIGVSTRFAGAEFSPGGQGGNDDLEAHRSVSELVSDELSRGRVAQAEATVVRVQKEIDTAKEHLGQHNYPRVSKKQVNWWPKESLDPVRSTNPEDNPLSAQIRRLNGRNGWDESGAMMAWKTSNAEDAANALECDTSCKACHKNYHTCSSCPERTVFFLTGWDYGGSCVNFPRTEGCTSLTYPSELTAQAQAIKDGNPVLHTKACTAMAFGQIAVENSGDNLIESEEDTHVERYVHLTVHHWAQTVCQGCGEDDHRGCSEDCSRESSTRPVEICYAQGTYYAPNSEAVREFNDWDCMDGEVKEVEVEYPVIRSPDAKRGIGDGFNLPRNATMTHCCYEASPPSNKFNIPTNHPWLKQNDASTLLSNFAATPS